MTDKQHREVLDVLDLMSRDIVGKLRVLTEICEAALLMASVSLERQHGKDAVQQFLDTVEDWHKKTAPSNGEVVNGED
tara:strand:+ start:2040 stop:2273 length:234 start_codon:yes stop_codon:yes gene_type:complete